MMHLAALVVGFCLDLLLGDPYWMPHPIRVIGTLISRSEQALRAVFPATPHALRAAGVVLVIVVVGVSATAAAVTLWLCGLVSPWLQFAVEAIMSYQMLATKCLKVESTKVQVALESKTLDDARTAVSMLVARDTKELTEEGVAKAAVETVAENTSDGVVAPLLFMAIGGPVLGVVYKAVNTMDSMVGYKNDKYEYFGTAAALLDDVLNFIPARVAGVLMCAVAGPSGFDGRNAWAVFKRDRRKHASPNSAHTEAACAGALRIQLAGPSNYFGKRVEKPFIGDPLQPIVSKDIARANRLLYATAFASLLVGLCLGGLVFGLFSGVLSVAEAAGAAEVAKAVIPWAM